MASHILLLFIMKGLWKLMLVVLPMGFLPPSWFSVDSCAFDCTNLENLNIAKKCWIVLPWEKEKKKWYLFSCIAKKIALLFAH